MWRRILRFPWRDPSGTFRDPDDEFVVPRGATPPIVPMRRRDMPQVPRGPDHDTGEPDDPDTR
jgi:hypothetical protein